MLEAALGVAVLLVTAIRAFQAPARSEKEMKYRQIFTLDALLDYRV
jgi:hypothetical protein